jgi:hypothetical protein
LINQLLGDPIVERSVLPPSTLWKMYAFAPFAVALRPNPVTPSSHKNACPLSGGQQKSPTRFEVKLTRDIDSS